MSSGKSLSESFCPEELTLLSLGLIEKNDFLILNRSVCRKIIPYLGINTLRPLIEYYRKKLATTQEDRRKIEQIIRKLQSGISEYTNLLPALPLLRSKKDFSDFLEREERILIYRNGWFVECAQSVYVYFLSGLIGDFQTQGLRPEDYQSYLIMPRTIFQLFHDNINKNNLISAHIRIYLDSCDVMTSMYLKNNEKCPYTYSDNWPVAADKLSFAFQREYIPFKTN